MPYYLARVELRGTPSGIDYDNLHNAMQQVGFLRIITISGKDWHLPAAEYACSDNRVLSAEYMRDELSKVVKSVYNDFLLLVSRTEDVSGILVPVK